MVRIEPVARIQRVNFLDISLAMHDRVQVQVLVEAEVARILVLEGDILVHRKEMHSVIHG